MVVLGILCGALGITAIILGIKIAVMQKSINEICDELSERLNCDTNTPIAVSSRDKYIRKLAAALNRELKLLVKQRRRYLEGDRRLKEAVTNISHDLRTPLTAICGYLDLLGGETLSEQTARYVSLIENRVAALKQLSEELFSYSVTVSTVDNLTLAPTDVNAVLEESIAAYYAVLTEKGITPQISITEKRIIRNADKTALARVFGNIISNAVKYSDGDLSVTLSDDGVAVFANTAKQLDEVQVGKLFDRFFSVATAKNSTGLGLAISKSLTEQMHGTISAKLSDGKLFIILSLPR